MSRALDVYLLDRKAGVLLQDDGGRLTFTYDRSYLTSIDARAISVSMTLREQAYEDAITRPYFSGLLPDERARARLASALHISEGNAFGLLEIIGGECAGALSLFPAGQEPPSQDGTDIEALDSAHLTDILAKLRTRPLLGGEDGVRMSLAGAQDKLAVCVEGDVIGLARNGRPTTHILKPFITALEGSVENELFCMRLAAKMKITSPQVMMRSAGKISFILIERYDRRRQKDGSIMRLHQEDFCQALSVPPELKYESETGPGIDSSQALIRNASGRPAADQLEFMRRIIFHYLVGNADAHAKNYALLYSGTVPVLAPAYDILCTAAYPNLAKELAMKIGGRNVPDTIHLKHWLALVPDTKGAQRQLIKTLQEMAVAIRTNTDQVMMELQSEGITHPLLDAIRKIIETRAMLVLHAAEASSESRE